MPTENNSRADQALAQEVTALIGRPVSARQVRRWRQDGLLPAPAVHRGGRGLSVAVYPRGAADVAAGVAQALADDRNLDRATLISFARKVGVGEKAVRRAYERVFTAEAKRLRKKQAVVSPGDLVASTVLRLALGEQAPDGGIAAVAREKGIDKMLVDDGLLSGEAADPELHAALDAVGFAHLAGTLADAEWVEVVAARDVVTMMRDGTLSGLPAEASILATGLDDDLTLALRVPWVLPLCRQAAGIT